jgi:YfiR/HmsC-like
MRSTGQFWWDLSYRFRAEHRVLWILVCVWLTPHTVVAQGSQAGGSVEYQVKAAYLLNFTRYVEWPSSSFSSPSAPIDICVLGDDPFGVDLDHAMENKSSDSHPLRVRRTHDRNQLDGCHLVFVSEREAHRNPEIAQRVTTPGVLTVGDNEQFARDGGVIGFIIQDETVRFVVNLDARDRARVRISSRVLSLASNLFPRGP